MQEELREEIQQQEAEFARLPHASHLVTAKLTCAGMYSKSHVVTVQLRCAGMYDISLNTVNY